MGLTPAPISAFPLAWIALTPLWVLLVSEKRKLTENMILGLVWGCGYHGLALFWITGVHPMTWMGVPWLASLFIAIFCWLFITLWGAILVVFWSLLMTVCSNLLLLHQRKYGKGIRVLIGVTFWCLLETIWSYGDLWWSSLSYTQSPLNLIILQLSQLSGPIIITASIVAVNGLVAEGINVLIKQGIKDKYKPFHMIPFPLIPPLNQGINRWVLSGVIFCLGLHLVGAWLYSRPILIAENDAIRVGIIQGNIPNEIKLYPEGWRKAIEGYTTGYKQLAEENVDVVLTPETALPFFWNELVKNSSFYAAVLEKTIPAWLGAFGNYNNSFTNSLFTVTGEGILFSRYDKVKLVPLGEYIPFEEFLGKFINRLSPLDAHLARGKSNQIFETPFGQAIVGICYESAFAEHFRRQASQGGEFIITASNNAHYSHTMPAQHHAQDVMRAIETNRWAARATNTGYSAIVDPKGRTLWISQINVYQIHSDTIYRRNTQTLYVKWGDWLTKVLLIPTISIIVLFWDGVAIAKF